MNPDWLRQVFILTPDEINAINGDPPCTKLVGFEDVDVLMKRVRNRQIELRPDLRTLEEMRDDEKTKHYRDVSALGNLMIELIDYKVRVNFPGIISGIEAMLRNPSDDI